MSKATRVPRLLGCMVIALAFIAGCGPAATATATQQPAAIGTAAPFTLSSPSFGQDEMMPAELTCDGANKSPQLQWDNSPDAKSFVLIVDDPDAPSGTYTHWVLFDIPGSQRGLPAGVADDGQHGTGALNSSSRTAYGGPCPPSGPAHHYRFTLYALDIASLQLPTKSARADVEAAMQGHLVGQVQLVGLYQRK